VNEEKKKFPNLGESLGPARAGKTSPTKKGLRMFAKGKLHWGGLSGNKHGKKICPMSTVSGATDRVKDFVSGHRLGGGKKKKMPRVEDQSSVGLPKPDERNWRGLDSARQGGGGYWEQQSKRRRGKP